MIQERLVIVALSLVGSLMLVVVISIDFILSRGERGELGSPLSLVVYLVGLELSPVTLCQSLVIIFILHLQAKHL